MQHTSYLERCGLGLRRKVGSEQTPHFSGRTTGERQGKHI